mmetsp:Transcript_22734/g.26706  ORF Transcript_22734/g.26706 Transcript_22734/m.26706 type:complete len:505 (-) Transcript_22734:142-1656(-)
MPPKVGNGLWKAVQMPPPKNYGPRIRPIENWSVKFDPKDPSTWRSGAGKAAMNAAEANNAEELKAVLAATPFVKYVLDFTEQLDAATRKMSPRTVAVLLPWCDMDAWRQCLLISAQLQNCAILNLLLCDIEGWPSHDAFRRNITGDEFHPLANSSLNAGAKCYAKATPFREVSGSDSLFDRSEFVSKGPWQRRRLLDILPSCSGGRHLILQRAAEAACRDDDLPLLNAVMVIAMEPSKVSPFAAAGWQPRANHWISSLLERSRSAAGATIVQGEVRLAKSKNFEAESAHDYLSVVNDVGGNKDADDKEKRLKEQTDLENLLARKRKLLEALDYYLAVAHGGAASHPIKHKRIIESRKNDRRTLKIQGGQSITQSSTISHTTANSNSNSSYTATTNSNSTYEQPKSLLLKPPTVDIAHVQAATQAVIAESTEEVVRFDRRVPMRDRYREAGDNPAWRGFVPQWTSELGAHRVWRNKLGQRSQLLHEFNTAVAGGSEKPPELEAGT